jgi:hypothetical protein
MKLSEDQKAVISTDGKQGGAIGDYWIPKIGETRFRLNV